MTTTSHIGGGAIAVWPEQESDDYQFEHAIVVVPYSGSITLEQKGNSVNIPLYALPQILRAMRTVGKAAEGK